MPGTRTNRTGDAGERRARHAWGSTQNRLTMTTEPTSTSEHPLRSRNAVPRSDIRRATVALAEALDAMLGAHASGADG
ncbi:MAG: hypothetical protein ACI867_001633, partial [Glaciecola sp.]